ncbi:hypothetical protein [Mixta sp. Marseille-Q2659]|uniref:hypothetical protein n=1 Tax=Mixta sp. Marseille-Q2659 TaxID=2736607 RepID=UPI0023B9E9F6|nr:hypothetical protein [Mixta sp. Marseille-Q2659]
MTSNDELERQKFNCWFEDNWRYTIKSFSAMERRRLQQIAWWAWLARSKQEQSDG